MPVCDHEYRKLNPRQELLYHYFLTGFSKLGRLDHLPELGNGFLPGIQDHHPFTGCQAIGLQYYRQRVLLQVGHAFLKILFAELTVSSRRDIVPQHELLGKGLAAFQLGAHLGRPHHRDMR